MENLVTSDAIIDWFKEQVEHKHPIAPSVWIDAAVKLNVLSGDEVKKFAELHQAVANLRKVILTSGETVSKAKVLVESTEEYKELLKQKAKLEMIKEMIRLAKQMSRMSLDEIKGY